MVNAGCPVIPDDGVLAQGDVHQIRLLEIDGLVKGPVLDAKDTLLWASLLRRICLRHARSDCTFGWTSFELSYGCDTLMLIYSGLSVATGVYSELAAARRSGWYWFLPVSTCRDISLQQWDGDV